WLGVHHRFKNLEHMMNSVWCTQLTHAPNQQSIVPNQRRLGSGLCHRQFMGISPDSDSKEKSVSDGIEELKGNNLFWLGAAPSLGPRPQSRLHRLDTGANECTCSLPHQNIFFVSLFIT